MTPITTPVLVRGMSDDDYHADPIEEGSLSSTFARLLTEHVPAKADERRKNRKPTKAMALGKAAHAHALGVGPKLIVWEHDGRTKAGKEERTLAAPLLATEAAVAVTEAEHHQIVQMGRALRSHAEVEDVLKTYEAEVSAFWMESAIWGRARIDLLGASDSFDFKTCDDASSNGGFQKSMGIYGYHQQAEWYGRGLRALKHPAGDQTMRFICQETEAPYLVQIHTPDDEAMDVAAELNDRAVGIFKKALQTGDWPGYPTLHAEPTSLSNTYFYRHADVLEHNPHQEMEMT